MILAVHIQQWLIQIAPISLVKCLVEMQLLSSAFLGDLKDDAEGLSEKSEFIVDRHNLYVFTESNV